MSDTARVHGSMPDSPAKKKRHPFSVKNGDRTHHVYCTKHAGEVATFYCAVCCKPYDEACVGEERGEQTVCIACADTALERELKKEQREGKTKRALLLIFSVMALAIITINVYILVKDSPTSEKPKQPEVTQQISDLLLCRHRLESLAAHAATFQQAFQHPPAGVQDLSNLVDDKQELAEPLTGTPFVVSTDEQQLKIECPNPEAHGLAGLYAVPGKPDKMIYRSSLGEGE